MEQWPQLLPETSELGAGTFLVDFDPLEPALDFAAGRGCRPHALGHLVRFFLALPQELLSTLDAFGRVRLSKLPALVAHLRRHF
jgi:hypothetical protein